MSCTASSIRAIRCGFLVATIGICCSAIGPSEARAEPAKDAAANWAQWRGPSGQGYSDDSRVPLAWSDKQNLLWKTELPGKGNSTPIVWGDRIFLTASSNNGDQRNVLCLRAGDGKILWNQTASQGVSPGRTHAWNGYASASCTTDGKYVYAFFGTPGLFCYDFDGKVIWKHNFGVFTASTGWGTGASPFLFEDLVIQNCDNDGQAALPKGNKAVETAPMALIALDKKTGDVRWQVERKQGIGWSTPVLITAPGGRTDLVLNGPHGVWGYDPRSGKEVWHCERHRGMGKALFGEAIPVFDRERLVMLSGRPGPMMAVRLGGTGDVTKTHVLWDVLRKTPRDVGSPILWKDSVYIGDRQGFVSCHEARTGKLLYRERVGSKSFTASPVAVRDRLLLLMEDGLTAVLEPGREFKVASRNSLSDGSDFRASPAVADGRLYLRSQSHLFCIGTK